MGFFITIPLNYQPPSQHTVQELCSYVSIQYWNILWVNAVPIDKKKLILYNRCIKIKLGGEIMFKRVYILATLILVVALTSIFVISIKTTQDLKNQGITEAEYLRQDIISVAESLISDELSKTEATLNFKSLNNTDLSEDEKRVEELLTFSEDFFDTLLVDEELAFSMLSNMLNEDEILLMEIMFSQAYDSDASSTEDILSLSVGYAKLRLYVHASWGWFYGRLSTTLLTIAITPIVVQFIALGSAAGGPVGVVVGALIGATLGVAIERYINRLVYQNGEAGFTYDLINTTLVEGWLVPFKITIQYNLLNAIFGIINFAGGSWSSGVAGATRPSSLPGLNYA